MCVHVFVSVCAHTCVRVCIHVFVSVHSCLCAHACVPMCVHLSARPPWACVQRVRRSVLRGHVHSCVAVAVAVRVSIWGLSLFLVWRTLSCWATLWGRLAFVWPDLMWEPVSPGGWKSVPGPVCPGPLCGFVSQPGFNDPRAHFQSGAMGAGVGDTHSTTEWERTTPNNTKEMKSLKQASGGGGLATTHPRKLQTALAGPPPTQAPSLAPPRAGGAP